MNNGRIRLLPFYKTLHELWNIENKGHDKYRDEIFQQSTSHCFGCIDGLEKKIENFSSNSMFYIDIGTV